MEATKEANQENQNESADLSQSEQPKPEPAKSRGAKLRETTDQIAAARRQAAQPGEPQTVGGPAQAALDQIPEPKAEQLEAEQQQGGEPGTEAAIEQPESAKVEEAAEVATEKATDLLLSGDTKKILSGLPLLLSGMCSEIVDTVSVYNLTHQDMLKSMKEIAERLGEISETLKKQSALLQPEDSPANGQPS